MVRETAENPSQVGQSACDEYHRRLIADLETRCLHLEKKLEINKIFIYMIIHDLKHPTEAVESTLKLVYKNINQQVEAQEEFLKSQN